MKKKCMILLTVFILLFGTIHVKPQFSFEDSKGVVSNLNQTMKRGIVTATTQTDQSALNVQKRNWNFETADSKGGPKDWEYTASAFSRTNTSYQDVVHLGSYSGLIQAKGTEMTSSNPYVYQYLGSLSPFLDEGLVLEFYWNALANPDLKNGSTMTVSVNFYNGSYYTIIYWLSVGLSYFPSSNETFITHYLLNGSLTQWNYFQQNLLDDFNARNGWSATSNMYLVTVYFKVFSPENADSIEEIVIDDIALTNSTTYDYLQNRNGNFESGDGSYWSGSGNNDPGYVSLANYNLHGNKVLNLTTSQTRDNVFSYATLDSSIEAWPCGIIPVAPETLLIDFYWNYQDTFNGGTQNAYLYLVFSNESYTYRIYYYLGNNMNSSLPANASYSSYSLYYIKAQGFGIRGKWVHFFLDTYDLVNDFGFTNIGLTGLELYTRSEGHSNATSQLLVDSFRVLYYPTGYPSFELESDGRTTVNPIPGWQVYIGSFSDFNHTHDSRSGDWALNITPGSGILAALTRTVYHQIDESSYLDFWWRLDELTSTMSSYSYLELMFENNRYIRYFVARDSDFTVSNTSSMVYYNIQELNTTGTWIHSTRNLTRDFQVGFGSFDANLMAVRFFAYNEPGGRISVLFDDVNIRDVVPPTSVSHNIPELPVYYQPTTIEINADDNRAGVKEVIVCYNYGSGWTNVTALNTITHFESLIPIVPWGTTVDYYLFITDYAGLTTIDDNAGMYYSFVVSDDIPPEVALTSPEHGSTLFDDVVISADASDLGSGIEKVEFLVDTISIANDTSEPFSVTWDTRSVSNGTHTLKVRAFDNQGLLKEDSITVDIQNDVQSPLMYSVMINPSQPLYETPTTVTVTVLDASGIKNVTLYYAVEESGSGLMDLAQDWVSITMTADGPVYSGTIPAQEYGKTILYYLVAYDIYEQATFLGTADEPYQVTVGDINDPSISIAGPSSGSTVKGTVNFSIMAADEGSGIKQVLFFVDNEVVSTLNTPTGSILWDTTQFTNGIHHITFEVQDQANNSFRVDMTFTVSNPDAIGAIRETFSNFMSAYGFFVGAGTMIGIFLIGKLLIKRRSTAKVVAKKKK